MKRSMKNKVRLSKKEINIIKSTARDVFGKEVKVLIFGSRALPEKKGGDIDILVKSPKSITTSKKLEFLAKLELRGIHRKVDLLVITSQMKIKEIHLEALRTGVEI